MSAIGMQVGKLNIGSYMPSGCSGALTYGNRSWACWNSRGHGPETLAGAIKESCNVYFYQAGVQIGLDAMLSGAAALGFGERTGIDLPFEIGGRYPESRDYYDSRYGSRGWTESVVWNLSIGQGENQQSLLRMASFYTALATGESPIRPHLAHDEVLANRRMGWSLGLSESQRLELVEAMRTVPNEPGGTAYSYRIGRWDIAGKTGTAQNAGPEPHSWFVGFAPAHDPKIVIASIVEEGHPDGTVSLAVPYAFGIVERYLESIGQPPDPGREPRVVSDQVRIVETAGG
jgi:penicillin-binding protein 2